MSLVRKINFAQKDLKEQFITNSYRGMELFGKTIGIIGLGSIGSKALKIAKGFSMNVLGYDLYQNAELKKEFDFEYVDIDNLCENADIISLYAPATKDNYHILDSERIAKMKDGVVIVNTARGELIDTEALYEALIHGKIAGAALDVLECEEAMSSKCTKFTDGFCSDVNCMKKTLINHKLLYMPNVIVTPHTAFDTEEAVNRILEITLDNVSDFMSSKKPKNIVV